MFGFGKKREKKLANDTVGMLKVKFTKKAKGWIYGYNNIQGKREVHGYFKTEQEAHAHAVKNKKLDVTINQYRLLFLY